MITAGIILLAIGVIAGIAPLWTIGALLLAAGAYLAFLGSRGQRVGGRRHYF